MVEYETAILDEQARIRGFKLTSPNQQAILKFRLNQPLFPLNKIRIPEFDQFCMETLEDKHKRTCFSLIIGV